MANLTKSKTGDTILSLIGNTPMIRLNRVVDPSAATVLAKLESFNPGGSVKDRICLAMIEDAETRGLLKPGATIVEPTSGNTGIGLAMIGAVKGYRVVLTMPETMSAERIQILKSYGAEVILTPAAEGMIGAVKRAEAIAKDTPGAYVPQQFTNPSNPQIHRQTTQRSCGRNGEIDAFVAGVGTGGTITGVGEVLSASSRRCVIAVEPKGSPSSRRESAPAVRHRCGFVPQV